ncbi:hypothetical protein KC992_02165 [Candidatus Saccharibacteria bacterium]|nr:hypothetical protein [Candidatus Saccharibacteria bacterium]MCA9328917.1 hypothetical protein [Candidatus Saccharibacteria bacterium]
MKKEVTLAVALLLMITVGGVAVTLVSGSHTERSKSSISRDSSAASGGIVSQLNTPQAAQSTDTNQAVAGASTKEVTEEPQKELKLNTPAGWQIKESKTDVSTCDPSKTQTITTYKKGSQTLAVYENADPSGCDGGTIGDVSVDFAFTENSLGIKTTRQAAYAQCTKEQNATCPKGDGKVTLFISSKKQNKNPLNDRTYAFKVEDTSIQPDFNAQVNALLDVVDTVAFEASETVLP